MLRLALLHFPLGSTLCSTDATQVLKGGCKSEFVFQRGQMGAVESAGTWHGAPAALARAALLQLGAIARCLCQQDAS